MYGISLHHLCRLCCFLGMSVAWVVVLHGVGVAGGCHKGGWHYLLATSATAMKCV
jgi:hypothetical protein